MNAIDATKATVKTQSNARNTIATFLNNPAPFHIESEGRALKPPRRPYGRYHFLRHDTAGGKGRYGWSSHVAEAGSECPLIAKSGRSWGQVSRSACDPKRSFEPSRRKVQFGILLQTSSMANPRFTQFADVLFYRMFLLLHPDVLPLVQI